MNTERMIIKRTELAKVPAGEYARNSVMGKPIARRKKVRKLRVIKDDDGFFTFRRGNGKQRYRGFC